MSGVSGLLESGARESGSREWIDSGLVHTRGTSLEGAPREQKMLKGHLTRIIHHRVYFSARSIAKGVRVRTVGVKGVDGDSLNGSGR